MKMKETIGKTDEDEKKNETKGVKERECKKGSENERK